MKNKKLLLLQIEDNKREIKSYVRFIGTRMLIVSAGIASVLAKGIMNNVLVNSFVIIGVTSIFAKTYPYFKCLWTSIKLYSVNKKILKETV